jgi:hypothetical protein
LKGFFPGGRVTSQDEREDSPNALESGLIVRDRAGVHKRILRAEGETVFWEYVDQKPSAQQQEHSSPYAEFADSHFVVPQSRAKAAFTQQASATEQAHTEKSAGSESVRKDTIYVDRQGRRVQVVEVSDKMVQWIGVDRDEGGLTPIAEFLKDHQPEEKAA